MFKKLAITIISVFLFSFNAYAGSSGELELKTNQTKEIKDCFEKLNRATFAFNQSIDKAIIKPIAKGYRNLPNPIQKGTSNAAKNLSNLITIPNNILQGDIKLAIINTGRLVDPVYVRSVGAKPNQTYHLVYPNNQLCLHDKNHLKEHVSLLVVCLI